jgi:hypothetical protein
MTGSRSAPVSLTNAPDFSPDFSTALSGCPSDPAPARTQGGQAGDEAPISGSLSVPRDGTQANARGFSQARGSRQAASHHRSSRLSPTPRTSSSVPRPERSTPSASDSASTGWGWEPVSPAVTKRPPGSRPPHRPAAAAAGQNRRTER